MFDSRTMRDTILGKISWRKCPQCDGTGYENWDEDGGDVKSGQSGNPNRATGLCDNCVESIGYVISY